MNTVNILTWLAYAMVAFTLVGGLVQTDQRLRTRWLTMAVLFAAVGVLGAVTLALLQDPPV